MPPRILLADDHKIMREGLRSLLEKVIDFTVVDEAETGRQAVALARKHNPDLVIMDIGMPDLNGIEATRQIRESLPHIKVIALSMHSSNRFVTGMLEAGASGYVLKSEAYEELVGAVRAVMEGRTFTSPKATDIVIEDYLRKLAQEPGSAASPLSPREKEVLQLLAEGKSTKDIATILNLSPHTVDSHRRKIMEKLDLHTIAELTRYALREGLTGLED